MHLSADQSTLVWSPWHDEEGADASCKRSIFISQVTCATKATSDRSGLVLQIEGDRPGARAETVVIEAAPKQVTVWAAALARMIAIHQQRHSYEGLYGGVTRAAAGGDTKGGPQASPRSLVVRIPRLQEALCRRQEELLQAQQRRLRTPRSGGKPFLEAARALARGEQGQHEQQRQQGQQADEALPEENGAPGEVTSRMPVAEAMREKYKMPRR